MYDLEKLSRTCFSDDGAASYPCGELFRGITTCRGRSSERKENSTLEKLELIYIFIRTTDRFQETNSISKAIQATY
jgi:hypothetical protein